MDKEIIPCRVENLPGKINEAIGSVKKYEDAERHSGGGWYLLSYIVPVYCQKRYCYFSRIERCEVISAKRFHWNCFSVYTLLIAMTGVVFLQKFKMHSI